MDRLFFRPLRQSPTIILVIASFGLMLMVRSLMVQIVWGVEAPVLQQGYRDPVGAVRLRCASFPST